MWGVYYGVILIIERMGLGKVLHRNKIKVINHIYTLLIVMVGWVIFRAETLKQAFDYIKVMFTIKITMGSYKMWYFLNTQTIITIIVAIMFCGIVQNRFHKLKDSLYCEEGIFTYDLFILPVILLTCIIQLVSGAYNPFIYFRF